MRRRVAFVGIVGMVGCLFADPYIESSGAQAINTGYHPGPKTKLVLDWAYTATTPTQQRIFSASEASNSSLYFSSYIEGTGVYSWCCQDGVGNWTSTGVAVTTDRRTLTIDGLNNQVTLTGGGVDVHQEIPFAHTKRANAPLILFGQPRNLAGTWFDAHARARVYSLQIYEDGKLVHDLRPRVSANAAGQDVGVMYDEVTGWTFASVTETPLVASEDCARVEGYAPIVPTEGLTIENANYPGAFTPQGDTEMAVSGLVTLKGDNFFGGALSLRSLPRTVRPREFTASGWSKDFWGKEDFDQQVFYRLTSVGGRTTFGGCCEDYTGIQRGDVVLFDGAFTFGGNVVPNGADGHLVFRNGASEVGSIGMGDNYGWNSHIYVERTASLTCAGDVFTSQQDGGSNPFHLHVDGTLTVNGTLSPYNTTSGNSSIQGAGTLNAHAFVANTMGRRISVSTLNLGTGGAQCTGTRFGAITIGCFDGDTVFSGSYGFADALTLRAATPDGAAADITLRGTPTAAGKITKTGAGALVLAAAALELTGGIDVNEGVLRFNEPATLAAPVVVAAGAELAVSVAGTVTLGNATVENGVTLAVEARPDGVGGVSLPAGAVKGRLAVRIDGANPPPVGSFVILAGAKLTAADLANVTLEVACEAMKGGLSLNEAGDLVFTVAESSTTSLTWSGAASRVWDEAAANWDGGLLFKPFDQVVFGATGAGEVQVAEGGVTPGAMVVSDGRYTFTGGPILGDGRITVEGGAVVGMGAKLDAQPIVVRSGVFRATAVASDLLGDPEAPITVEAGGTFDLNINETSSAGCLMTYNKKFRIAGEGATGADGVRFGALVNLVNWADYAGRLHEVELTGDAMIKAGQVAWSRWDVRNRGDGISTDRPRFTGRDYTLTIGGGNVNFVDTDIDLKGFVVVNGAKLGLEGGSKETLPEGVRIQQGCLQFWEHVNTFTEAILAEGADTCLRCGLGTATLTGPVRVAAGATLRLEVEQSTAVLRFAGGELNVGAGATFRNTVGTAFEIAGAVNGTGTIEGAFTFTGTWNLAMDDGRTLKGVKWANGVDLSQGRLHIALTKTRPLKPKYDLGLATGLDGIESRLAVTLDGEPYEGGLTVVQEGDRAVLVNLKPANMVIYLR